MRDSSMYIYAVLENTFSANHFPAMHRDWTRLVYDRFGVHRSGPCRPRSRARTGEIFDVLENLTNSVLKQFLVSYNAGLIRSSRHSRCSHLQQTHSLLNERSQVLATNLRSKPHLSLLDHHLPYLFISPHLSLQPCDSKQSSLRFIRNIEWHLA